MGYSIRSGPREAAPAVAETDNFSLAAGLSAVVANPFQWDSAKLEAVAWFAEGRYYTKDVAGFVGVDVRTVASWRSNRQFREAVAELQERILEKAAQAGLQRKTARAARLEQRLEQLESVFEERAASADPSAAEELGVLFDPESSGVPGASTGLMLKSYKSVGSGESVRVVVEHAVDDRAVRLEADLSRQLATELGQWTEKSETTMTRKLYINVNIDDV